MQDGVNTPFIYSAAIRFSQHYRFSDSSCDAQVVGAVPRLSMNVTQGPVALLLLLSLPTEG